MGRSALFSTLRRLMKRAHVASVTGSDPGTPSQKGPTRRDLVRGAFGAAALAPLIAACGDNTHAKQLTDKTVAIIGGGIAGMSCAHFLSLAGVTAQVYEASLRIGGRTYTKRDGFEAGQIVELGGELVDSGHIVMQALVQTFNLHLDDLPAITDGLTETIFHVNGMAQTELAIVTEFTPVAAKMATAVMAGDADATEYARIDNMSIPDWLTLEAGLPDTSMIKKLLEVAYVEEFGLEVAEQSAWNLITLIDYSVVEPFHVFGDSDERYHIHEGSDAIALAIADQLADQITFDRALTKVSGSDTAGFDLTFMSMDGEVVVHADHVVYALPFTKLREVDLTGAGLSADKLNIITTLGYGTNAKLMMQFANRPWEIHGSAGSVITDVGMLQTTWATSRGQDGDQGILTNFVGGTRGIQIGEGTADAQATTVLPWVETIWSGSAAKYNGKNVRQHWPTAPYAKGSYASYKRGQWAFFGHEGKAEGNQHFCGEHCSEAFQGYMEGGAETGAMVAAELLDGFGIRQPDILAGLLAQLVMRPRASYHGGFGAVMTIADLCNFKRRGGR